MSLFSLVSVWLCLLCDVCNSSCLPLSSFFGCCLVLFFNAFSYSFPTSSRTEVKQHVWQVAGSVAVVVVAAVAFVVVVVVVVLLSS